MTDESGSGAGSDPAPASESAGESEPTAETGSAGTRESFEIDGSTPSDGDFESAGPAGDGEEISRCDYCRLPIPGTAIQLERDGITYRFCSDACRDCLREQEQVFTEYHGHRRLSTGVSVLDASLPQGVPRNSFVMIGEVAGSRIEAVQAELAWRALQRGEPVVFVTFLEPPVSVVQGFVDMEWNVLPSLERGTLQILDCFSYLVEDRNRMYERMNAWNRHLWDVASEATTTVRDPSDTSELQNRIDSVLEDANMHDRGIVVLDSLVELGTLVQPVQAYGFVKDVRADVCKGRFVPIFAGATVSNEGDGFPHDLGYMVDGIVDLNQDGELIEDALIKRMRVRKMNGVLSYPQWQTYEYAAGAGAVAFDPVAEQKQSRAADDASGGDGEATDPDDRDRGGQGQQGGDQLPADGTALAADGQPDGGSNPE